MDALEAMKAAATIAEASEAGQEPARDFEVEASVPAPEADVEVSEAPADEPIPQPDAEEDAPAAPKALSAEEQFRRLPKEERPTFAAEMIRLCAEASGDRISAVRHGKPGHQPEHLLPDDDPEPEIWSAESRNGRTYVFRNGMVHRMGALPVGLTMERFREGIWEVTDGANWYRPTGDVKLAEWVRALGKGLIRVGGV